MGLLSNVSIKLLVVYTMFGIKWVLITMLDVFIFVCEVIRGSIAVVVVCFITIDSVLFLSIMVDMITALDVVGETRKSPAIDDDTIRFHLSAASLMMSILFTSISSSSGNVELYRSDNDMFSASAI